MKKTIQKAAAIKEIMEYIIDNHELFSLDPKEAKESWDAWRYVFEITVDNEITEKEYNDLLKMIGL